MSDLPPFPLAAAHSLFEQRLLAFHAVLSAKEAGDTGQAIDHEYFLRRVFRWYGRTFSVSPHLVEQLPIDYVVRQYWEVRYEQMVEEGDERMVADEARSLSEDPSLRRARATDERAKKEDDERWHRALELKEAERQKRLKEAAVSKVDRAVSVPAPAGESFKIVFEVPEGEDLLGGSPQKRA